MISQSLLDNQPQTNQSLREAGTGGAREPAAQTPKNPGNFRTSLENGYDQVDL